jgi:hypothetical protein
MKVKGWPVRTLLRGQSIVIDAAWHGKQGGGAYLRRSPHAEVL